PFCCADGGMGGPPGAADQAERLLPRGERDGRPYERVHGWEAAPPAAERGPAAPRFPDPGARARLRGSPGGAPAWIVRRPPVRPPRWRGAGPPEAGPGRPQTPATARRRRAIRRTMFAPAGAEIGRRRARAAT